jgi:hemoglobin-like flavoprotein
MGGGNSSAYMDGNNDTIVSVMMPVYYVHNAVVTPEDVTMAKASWNLIIEDKSEEFHRKKKEDPNFSYYSCISWFFSLFYSRLFDVHPLCKPLFSSGLQSQGKFLVKMISITLSQLGDKEAFSTTMAALTVRHCEKGVKAIEYGVVGDVLFFVIKACVGPAAFTPEIELAWIKVYSQMLQNIVPLAVTYERKGLHQGHVKRSRYIVESSKTMGAEPSVTTADTYNAGP